MDGDPVMADPQGPTAQWTPELERQYQAWKAQRDAAGPEDIPLNALKDVVRVPAEQIASIPTIMRAVSGNAPEMGRLAEGMVRHYADLAQHPIQNFYERPIATVMDVVAPLRGGAGVLKARGVPGAGLAEAALAKVDPSAVMGRAVDAVGRKIGPWLDRASVRFMSGALKPAEVLERTEPRSTSGPTPDIEKVARTARDTGLIVSPKGGQKYLDESKAIRQASKREQAKADRAGATVDMAPVVRSGYAAVNKLRKGTSGVPLSEIQAANARVREVAANPEHRVPVAGKPGKFRPGPLPMSKGHQTKSDMYALAKASFDINKRKTPTDVANRAMASAIRQQMTPNISALDAVVSQRAPVNAAVRKAMPRITNRAPITASALAGMTIGALVNAAGSAGSPSLGSMATHGMLPGLLIGSGLAAINSPLGASNLSQMMGRWSTQVPPLTAGIGGGLSTAGSASRVTEDAMREALLSQLSGSTEKP